MRRKTSLWLITFILFFGLLSVFSSAQEDTGNKEYIAIDENNLRSHIKYLSSDELKGRFALSEDYVKAAHYIQSQMRDIGILPAGSEGDYFQRLNLYQIGPDPIKQFSIISPDGDVVFRYGEDFTAGTGWSMEAGKVDLRADIVFVGYGVVAPEYNYNDYQELDVKGKVIIMVEGEPQYQGLNFFQRIIRFFKRGTKYGKIGSKIQNALDREVRGIINISKVKSDSKKWKKWLQRMEKSSGYAVSAPENDIIAKDYRFYFLLNREAGDVLLRKLVGSDIESFDKRYSLLTRGLLNNSYLEIKGNYLSRPVPSMNVVGKIEGDDPYFSDEHIIIGAHLDHIGKRKGEICPGADDNASGCAALLEIGRALVKGPKPKRSILLIFFSGEEIGGLGSYYYTEHPHVPLEKTRAMINLDCVGRNGSPDEDPNTIYIIGSEEYSSELKEACEKVNQQTENFRISYYYDAKGKESLAKKGDQHHFNLKGIPTLFYHTGQHGDIHRPSDIEEKIDYQKLARVCRLIYSAALHLANLDYSLTHKKSM